MKIATWNLERPNKSTSKNQTIIDCLTKINADILILTETNEIINLGNSYNCFHTSKLEEPYYKNGERRVSIYSKYDFIEDFITFRADTSTLPMSKQGLPMSKQGQVAIRSFGSLIIFCTFTKLLIL
jgi:hypothetical protein